MAKLIYSLNGSFLGEFTLNKDTITIGRRPSNDIHIDNLVISGEHAVIKVIGRDAFLEDAGSTNGTFV
ncbi:MAG TPA: FHA domain-containing protein, partial [Methylophilaceae bacterium]|nr:FHA domain-containing protein [Methylophilaceae bacterium]